MPNDLSPNLPATNKFENRAPPRENTRPSWREIWNPSMYKVGLTGGIGSGKSSVASCFRDLGITVVDADQVARKVVEPGMPALAEIARHFGEAFILGDGNLDRARLRDAIFRDEKEKQWLENLLHPLIRELTRLDLESATTPYVILESPLLIEMGQTAQVHRVLVVDVPVEVQIARASQRDGNSAEQIQAIIAAQISREERLAHADDVIDNTCTLDELSARVAKLHRRYLELAAGDSENA